MRSSTKLLARTDIVPSEAKTQNSSIRGVPFVKWAGGKRSLTSKILSLLPKKIGNYYEPFVGGGAVYFALEEFDLYTGKAFLSDANEELIITYKTLQTAVEEVISLLKNHAKNHCKKYYLKVRSSNEIESVKVAARFIYLNRTCFNGLYRVNAKGEFNVPMGKYENPNICDAENLRRISEILKSTTLKCMDFRKIKPTKSSLIYCDPPYHQTYNQYTSNLFGASEQEQLAEYANNWANKGASVIISNSDTPLIRSLYPADKWTLHEVSAPRTINSNASDRKRTVELLISSTQNVDTTTRPRNRQKYQQKSIFLRHIYKGTLAKLSSDSPLRKPYHERENVALYKGDSLGFLKEIPDNSVDMIFADPPYFLSNGSFTCQNGKMASVKKADWDLGNGMTRNFEFHCEWIGECRRILKPNGTIWISGTYHSIFQCGFALEMHKFHFLNDIAWFKPNASPNLSCRFFTASHETLIWARKDKKGKHTFNYKAMVEWENNYQKEVKCGHCGEKDYHEVLHKKGKQMRSVWAINTPQKTEKSFGKHPTQKALELLKRIVLASTNKGDLVLDPFTGSSTTGVAATLFGRKFIGIDNEKKYLDLSIKRLQGLDNDIKKKQEDK